MLKLSTVDQENVVAALDVNAKEQQKRRRAMLDKQISPLCYLVRQGIALRGHDDQDGNLYQLLRMWATHDAELSKWLADGKYLSHDIVNEQVKIMAGIVLRGIIKDIQSAGFYAVLADEASDVCEHEQLCATIRWVEKDFTICEEPVGLFCVSKTDSSTLFTVMKDILCRCSLPLALCRGQAYDGAANMSGL